MMPVGAQVLSVHSKDNEPQLWALGDDAAPKERRLFLVAATGEDLGDFSGPFIGTVLKVSATLGTLVFHVFDVTRSTT
jgi:hypothetical protein